MVFLATVFADSIDLKGVASGEVMVFATDLLLELTDFPGKELDGAATVGTDHVVMAAPVVLVFVTGNAVVEGDLAGQAALRQQFQRAVDRCVADAGIFFLDQAVEFVGREVVAGFQESVQNGVTLRRLFQANGLEVAVKDLLGFADHLAGDGGLIIDTLLQHGMWN